MMDWLGIAACITSLAALIGVFRKNKVEKDTKELVVKIESQTNSRLTELDKELKEHRVRCAEAKAAQAEAKAAQARSDAEIAALKLLLTEAAIAKTTEKGSNALS